jgi:ribosomal-protein-alanine N-acetyltransferase
MNILSPFVFSRKDPELEGQGVLLRFPRMEDYAQWRDLREASRNFLVPWEPAWDRHELERSAFRRRLVHFRKWLTDGTGRPFFIFSSDSGQLLGGITLSNLRRGVAQCATLGYWIGEPFARRGHMSDAVAALKAHGFRDLGLHRIEAACLPRNTASVRLLERSGFEREGFAVSYLKINGLWEDHILWSCREPLQ